MRSSRDTAWLVKNLSDLLEHCDSFPNVVFHGKFSLSIGRAKDFNSKILSLMENKISKGPFSMNSTVDCRMVEDLAYFDMLTQVLALPQCNNITEVKFSRIPFNAINYFLSRCKIPTQNVVQFGFSNMEIDGEKLVSFIQNCHVNSLNLSAVELISNQIKFEENFQFCTSLKNLVLTPEKNYFKDISNLNLCSSITHLDIFLEDERSGPKIFNSKNLKEIELCFAPGTLSGSNFYSLKTNSTLQKASISISPSQGTIDNFGGGFIGNTSLKDLKINCVEPSCLLELLSGENGITKLFVLLTRFDSGSLCEFIRKTTTVQSLSIECKKNEQNKSGSEIFSALLENTSINCFTANLPIIYGEEQTSLNIAKIFKDKPSKLKKFKLECSTIFPFLFENLPGNNTLKELAVCLTGLGNYQQHLEYFLRRTTTLESLTIQGTYIKRFNCTSFHEALLQNFSLKLLYMYLEPAYQNSFNQSKGTFY